MITAEKLTLLTRMPTHMLEMSLPVKDRPQLQTARFLGMTNGGEFCYSATDTGGAALKLFVKYDPATDKITADQ